MKHLKLDVYYLYEHAERYMERLGITYQQATPQSIIDCWFFWNCENIPDDLPEELSYLEVDAIDYIGYGLSKEEADIINTYGGIDEHNT